MKKMNYMNIFITGATAGIGRDAAIYLASNGHRVFAAGRRADRLASLRTEAGATDLRTIVLDVADEESVRRATDEVDRLTGGHGVDALVNNAGYGMNGPLELITDAELRAQFDVNVFGLMSVTRAFLPKMRERGSGYIVNISSVSGRVTFPFMGPYVATKHAVEALSDALRMELHRFGVKVAIIEPGPIRTEFIDVASGKLDRFRSIKTPYDASLRRGDKMLRDFNKSAAPARAVSHVIEKIISKKRPAARYVVPRSNAISVWLLNKLPTPWADALKRSAFAI